MKLALQVSLLMMIAACNNTGTSSTEKIIDTPQQTRSNADTTSGALQETKPKAMEDYFTPAGDSMILPPFEITVDLTAKATQTLRVAKETIIVSAIFSGIPKDTMMKEYRQWGELSLGEKRIEMPAPGTARFTNAKISKKDFETLGSKDIQILINVFSGRKSTGNNLLNCEILQEPISKIRLQKNVLKGKLLFGE